MFFANTALTASRWANRSHILANVASQGAIVNRASDRDAILEFGMASAQVFASLAAAAAAAFLSAWISASLGRM